jgi:hypothetical protein
MEFGRDWGGKIQSHDISAKTGLGLELFRRKYC